ncbi:hypothetical protein [Streptomyces sp. NPDC051909]|uniref:hypothetical protein n=1 Tax=Streptomyces sp. NPDC051909 TaxID=3154944 RepID=UPI00343F6AF5
MFDEDGSLDPPLKFLLYAVLALAVGNGFTQPALDFASRHRLITVGREDLKRWAHGAHLYDVIRARTTP